MDWLFSRATIVALAVVGGVFSVLAWLRQTRGSETGWPAGWWSFIGYVFMAASIALFIVAGFRKSGL
jgi:amino acid transporter